MKKKELFVNIAGYDDVKKELMSIYKWYTDKELRENKNVTLPTGILFYGRPGNGKTLFIREYVKALKVPSFTIDGDKDKVESIKKAFDDARKEKFSLVLIDEVDLLIRKDCTATRILQSEMDGIKKEGKILVLATANIRDELPGALTRAGRFDRLIHISNPKDTDREKIIEFYLKELKIDTNKIDIKHLGFLTNGDSCSSIKSIINDAFLRCKSAMTTQDLEKSYYRLLSQDYSDYNPLDYKNYRIAIHEAGHAIMALRFRKHIKLYSALFRKEGGETRTYLSNESVETIERRLQTVHIALAGAACEKIFFKKYDLGCISDFARANNLMKRLVERTCYSGFKHIYIEYVEPEWGASRSDSEEHRFGNEKEITKLTNKMYRSTIRYLKRHKKEVKKFADLLYKKGEVKMEDVNSLFPKGVKETPISKHLIPNNRLIKKYENKC